MANNRRRSAPKKEVPFNGIPGTGVLMPAKALGQGNWAWQGPLNLEDGRKIVMFGRSDPKEGWHVQFKQQLHAATENQPAEWVGWGECEMTPFGEARKPQDMIVEGIGKLRAYPGITQAGQNCVRFTILNKNGRMNAPIV